VNTRMAHPALALAHNRLPRRQVATADHTPLAMLVVGLAADIAPFRHVDSNGLIRHLLNSLPQHLRQPIVLRGWIRNGFCSNFRCPTLLGKRVLPQQPYPPRSAFHNHSLSIALDIFLDIANPG
jgi:hypothetical protein